MQRYPYIDVLRAIAALLVVWYHVIMHSQGVGFPAFGYATLPRIGWIGVDLFFVISGFVIGKAALDAQTTSQTWRATFIERRARRIVPLYLATSACYLFLVEPNILRAGVASIKHVVTHLLFIHNLWPDTAGSINGPSWSIALEVQFYALVVLVAPWLARTAWWRVLVAGISLALAWRYATTLIWVPGQSDPWVQLNAANQLMGTLDGFGFGMCLAKLAIAGQLQFSVRRFIAATALTVLALTAAWLTFWPHSGYWTSPAMVVFWRTLLSAGFAGLLACAVMLPWSPTRWSRPFRYLGEISYGVYLWHVPVLMTLVEKTQWKGVRLLSVTLVFTTILAALSWHGFEKLWMKPRSSRVPTASNVGAVA
jgi:peptidoglycan/LPS O-acetylase OafA/YrhL